MDTIELVEHFLKVLALDADTCIANGEIERVVIVPRVHVNVERLVLLAIFHSVVEQVVDHVLEMHLVDKDGRVYSFYLRIDMASRVLDAQREGVSNIFNHFVEVKFLFLEGSALTVEHRHLQHLIDQEAQALGLIEDDTPQIIIHLFCLRHRIVAHHLCSKRDTGDGCLQLVRHVIDEVVLDF